MDRTSLRVEVDIVTAKFRMAFACVYSFISIAGNTLRHRGAEFEGGWLWRRSTWHLRRAVLLLAMLTSVHPIIGMEDVVRNAVENHGDFGQQREIRNTLVEVPIF
jgi:hypothetical protein